MELLHTPEECKEYTKLYNAIYDLQKIQTQLNYDSLQNLINQYQSILDKELEKYNSYIGIEATVPPAKFGNRKERRSGKIEGKFYFTHNSVRCSFRYGVNNYEYSQGWDTHDIKDMIKITN